MTLEQKVEVVYEKWSKACETPGEKGCDELLKEAITQFAKEIIEDCANECEKEKEIFRDNTKLGTWGRVGCIACQGAIRKLGETK